jgi:hypothetical protein
VNSIEALDYALGLLRREFARTQTSFLYHATPRKSDKLADQQAAAETLLALRNLLVEQEQTRERAQRIVED